MKRDTVEVRWLALDRIRPGHWAGLEGVLDEVERARADRFRFERDRNAYVAAHALVRSMLSADAPHAPWAWRFAAGAHGKPEIIRIAGSPPLRFNLSHTSGLVAAAVTLDSDVGIDVEAVDPDRLTLDLATRYFAASEMEHLRSLPADRQVEAMFAFWTLKEAYIKADGRGLSLPLDAFSCRLEPLSISFAPSLEDDPACWLLRRLKPLPGHALALALRHPTPAAVTVRAQAIDAEELSEMVTTGGRRQPF